MIFVYVIESEIESSRFYVGITNDPARRLLEHNGGSSIHTNKFRPWKLTVTVGFANTSKATDFERYLKSGSGRAFAKRHF